MFDPDALDRTAPVRGFSQSLIDTTYSNRQPDASAERAVWPRC